MSKQMENSAFNKKSSGVVLKEKLTRRAAAGLVLILIGTGAMLL